MFTRPPRRAASSLAAPALTAWALSVLATTAIACAGAAPSPAAPDLPCTAMACLDGLRIELAPAAGTWGKGSYTFEVVTPAGTTTCEGSLPLPACDAGAALRCSGPPVSIGESGCALPAEQQGFASLELNEGPATFAVTIRKDGAELAKQTFTPAYRTVSPNGPQCGPTCRQASDTLRW